MRDFILILISNRIEDSLGFVMNLARFDYTTVSFLHPEVFTICGSRPGRHGHGVRVMG
jgi:hypothetical protein